MSAPGRPVMFRAGTREGERPMPASARTVFPLDIAEPAASTWLADISEFEPDISDTAYLAWSKAVIIRAAYGDAHDDRAWYGGQRRALLLAGGARFLGIYQYLVAGQDAAAQARALVRLLGKLNPGEVVICDLEEGSGNQAARLAAWAGVVSDAFGVKPWSYSGEFFARSAGIAPVTWVAAYQAAEPSVRHTLWQFTDAWNVPGVGSCDCSVFRGSIGQLAAMAFAGSSPVPPITPPAPPPVTPVSWTEHLMSELPTLTSGDSGEDVKSVQGLLCARGYTVAIDGSYGPATRSAVTALQHSRGIPADGVTGPVTWLRLHGRTS